MFALWKDLFLPFDIIETDHIIPIARGGSHKTTNLQLLHALYVTIKRYRMIPYSCAKRNSFPSIV